MFPPGVAYLTAQRHEYPEEGLLFCTLVGFDAEHRAVWTTTLRRDLLT